MYHSNIKKTHIWMWHWHHIAHCVLKIQTKYEIKTHTITTTKITTIAWAKDETSLVK